MSGQGPTGLPVGCEDTEDRGILIAEDLALLRSLTTTTRTVPVRRLSRLASHSVEQLHHSVRERTRLLLRQHVTGVRDEGELGPGNGS